MTEKVRLKWDAKIEVAKAVIIERYANGESLVKNTVGKETTWSHIKAMEKAYGNWSTAIETLTDIKNYKEYAESVKYSMTYNTLTLDEVEQRIRYYYNQFDKPLSRRVLTESVFYTRFSKRLTPEIKEQFLTKYGTYEDAVKSILGFDFYKERDKVIRTKAHYRALYKLKAKILDRYNMGESVSKSAMGKNIKILDAHYGSYGYGIECICKIDSYEEYIQDIQSKNILAMTKWNKNTLKDWLLSAYNNGEDVRACALQKKHIFECIIREYGTYEALWVACDLDYTQYKMDNAINTGILSTSLSVLGHKFEALMDDILLEFGYDYNKYKISEDTKLSPDHIFTNGAIGDSKLTYSYFNLLDVVTKYSKYSYNLEIYTLNSNKDKFIASYGGVKVRVYNIDYFIKMLPDYLQDIYAPKVQELRIEYNKIYEDFREAV